MFEVLTTEEFDKDFGKLDRSIKERVAKVIEQLRSNPFTGKPLGYEFFREKKIGKYRIYCLISSLGSYPAPLGRNDFPVKDQMSESRRF